MRFWICLIWLGLSTVQGLADFPRGEYSVTQIRSSIDGTEQACGVFIPKKEGERPVLVFLHSWSWGLEQDNTRWLNLAKERDWIYLQPDFRGKNLRPEACGSELARQDILDAMQWTVNQNSIDTSQIYLAGTSGGGHLALLMAGYYPDRFSAISAWVGISDLAKWYEFTSARTAQARYAKEIEACLGGKPGTSDPIIEQTRRRSPIFHLANAKNVPIDINTGVHDGHTGSVPVSQSFDAFNVLLAAQGKTTISDDVIKHWLSAGADRTPKPGVIEDASYSRAVLFRAVADESRLTVFEGTHEDLPSAGMRFLESHPRLTQWRPKP